MYSISNKPITKKNLSAFSAWSHEFLEVPLNSSNHSFCSWGFGRWGGIIKGITGAAVRDLQTLALLSWLVARWSQSAVHARSKRDRQAAERQQQIPESQRWAPSRRHLPLWSWWATGPASSSGSPEDTSPWEREKSQGLKSLFPREMSTAFGKENLFWLLLINSPLLIPEDAACLKTSSPPTSRCMPRRKRAEQEIKNSSAAVCTLSLWLLMPLRLPHFKQARQRKQSLAFPLTRSSPSIQKHFFFFSFYYGSFNLNFPRWFNLLHSALTHKNSPRLIIRHPQSNRDSPDGESACGGSKAWHRLEPPHAT